LLAMLMSRGEVPLEEAGEFLGRTLYKRGGPKERGKHYFYPNQFFRFEGDTPSYAVVTGEKVRNKDGAVIALKNPSLKLLSKIEQFRKTRLLGVSPTDAEQALAMKHVLLDRDVRIGFLVGKAGTGKTILSYAAGVSQVLVNKAVPREERFRYRLMYLMKPNLAASERGFLPGDLYEKHFPTLRSFEDAHDRTVLRNIPFETMFQHPSKPIYSLKPRPEVRLPDKWEFPKSEVVRLVDILDIRGMTWDRLVLVDEVQNYTSREVKDIVSRMGKNSKIVFLGDLEQIDNDKNTKEKNGLVAAIDYLLGDPGVALIYLSRINRDPLAEVTGWNIYS